MKPFTEQENLDQKLPVESYEDLAKKLAESEIKLQQMEDMLLRARAEVENIRRRSEQDVQKAHKYALEKFAQELLLVVDNLEHACDAVEQVGSDQQKAIYEGIDLTLKTLSQTLEKFNIKTINPDGQPFDPAQHEALSMLPTDDVKPNTVLQVVQKGYILSDRLLRPARVVVSKSQA